MTDKEFFEKSLEISTEFDKYIFAHPDIAEKIPSGALIVFEIEDDLEFTQKSFETAKKNKEKNQSIVVVKIKSLLPPLETRLLNPKLEPISKLP